MANAHYRITSEYLAEVVDPEKPILEVGPGWAFTSSERPCPMDIAIAWFLDRLKESSGRLDIVDLHEETKAGGSHNLGKTREWVNGILNHIGSVEVRYRRGDIARISLPDQEYGFIWDHGTLEEWTDQDPITKAGDPATGDRRRKRTLRRYHNSLAANGKIAIAMHEQGCPLESMLKAYAAENRLGVRGISVGEDMYAVSFGKDCIAELLGPRSVYATGDLMPYYDKRYIVELSKTADTPAIE